MSFVEVISWCLNDRHHRKRLEPARYCCCPVRELPLGLLLGPVHFIGVWSWVQWRGWVSAVSSFLPLKSGLEPTSQKPFQLHAIETDYAREWLNRTGARFPRGPRERTSFKKGRVYIPHNPSSHRHPTHCLYCPYHHHRHHPTLLDLTQAGCPLSTKTSAAKARGSLTADSPSESSWTESSR